MHQWFVKMGVLIVGCGLSFSVSAQSEAVTSQPLVTCSMSGEEWAASIDMALLSYQKMDLDGFVENRKTVLEGVLCLTTVVSPEQIALFHLMEMLAAFPQKDKATLGAHARAAYMAAPHVDLQSQGLVNDGHPILQWYSFAVAEQTTGTRMLPTPEMGMSLYIDGVARYDAPTDLPFLFQRVVDGVVEQSAVVGLDDSIPLYPLYTDTTLRVSLNPIWTWVAIGSTGVSLSSMALASRNERQFWNPATPNSELNTLQRRTNVYSGVGIAMGLTGVGALATAIVFGTK